VHHCDAQAASPPIVCPGLCCTNKHADRQHSARSVSAASAWEIAIKTRLGRLDSEALFHPRYETARRLIV